MAPGIVRYEGDFSKGDLVFIVDEKYGKPLALGEIMCDAETARTLKQGVIVRNIHHVGDKVWNLVKRLT
jgi:PUA domain protein